MSKQEFITQLRKGLSGLPKEDIEEHLNFYSEMIDDRIEEGLTEEEAVSQSGTVNEIISDILNETSIIKLVKEKVTPKRTLQTWEIVLLVLGSPIWFSLLIAVVSVIFSGYIVIWSMIVSLFAVLVSLGVCSIMGVIELVVFIAKGNVSTGFAMLGVGLFCAGLTILMYFVIGKAVKCVINLTKKMTLGIKSLFIEGSK